MAKTWMFFTEEKGPTYFLEVLRGFFVASYTNASILKLMGSSLLSSIYYFEIFHKKNTQVFKISKVYVKCWG